ncbi:hypothetical protein VMCG_08915 [Cytospora schulzeri]|uniref:Major facilitator superfamily (MFS) profile domain-containing protein n=1 Tax=Cytospora schulzeri TaxID=448051 RepID=A0A423VNI1_9PEZI|nr:hypothetical protein VMCG_08915 [Valsa malicola]
MAIHGSDDQITEHQSQAQFGGQQDPDDADTEKRFEVKAEDASAGDTSSPPSYSIFTSTQKGWILFIAAWAGWFSTASSFIYFPAIPFLANDMHVSVQDINLTVTSYLIASGIFPTVTGSAADIYGRRITLLVSLTAYAAINVGLATQRSFAALFVLRMLQSVAISAAQYDHASRRATSSPHARREGEPPSLSSASPPDFQPTPRADDSSQPIIPSPQNSSLMGSGSLLAIAREHSPQPRDDDASRRDVLENAVIPLLGMHVAGMDEAGMEDGHHDGIFRNHDPYADLPGDQDLLNLFSLYRSRVHPFQLIIDDLDAVEGGLCAIINERAGSSSSAETSQPRRQ